MLYETKFLISAGITCAVEVPIVVVAGRFLKGAHESIYKWVFVAFFASLLTLPYLWFVLPPYFDKSYYPYVGEGIVVVVEAFLYVSFFSLKIRHAFLLSLVANFVSFWVGRVI